MKPPSGPQKKAANRLKDKIQKGTLNEKEFYRLHQEERALYINRFAPGFNCVSCAQCFLFGYPVHHC